MAEAEKEDFRKKCAQTGTNLKRVKRYFRNGRYFVNKNAFKLYEKAQSEKKAEEAATAQNA